MFFTLLGAACGEHVGIGLVHALLSIDAADQIYNRLQNTYFAVLTIAVNLINLLLLLSSPPRTGWRRAGFAFCGASLAGVAVHVGTVAFLPNLWVMRTVWVVTDSLVSRYLLFLV